MPIDDLTALGQTALGTGTLALLLGTLAQLVSTWYFDMITAFIPKLYSKNLLPSTLTTVIRWLKIVRVLGTASLMQNRDLKGIVSLFVHTGCLPIVLL